MGDILGIGTTHYPPGLVPEDQKPWPLARVLHTDPRIPVELRNPANWSEPSWSHAFLTEKNHFLYPDLEADRALLAQLRAGDYDAWRDLSLRQLEASGQHEVLNWICLAGAMSELGYKMELLDWVETWIFNAPKCLAVFR